MCVSARERCGAAVARAGKAKGAADVRSKMHFQDILLQIRVTGHAILAQVAGSNHDGRNGL